MTAKTTYIFKGDNEVLYRIDTAEGYCNRRQLSQKSSSIKKLQRMSRVYDAGFRKTVATREEVRRFGPAINVS